MAKLRLVLVAGVSLALGFAWCAAAFMLHVFPYSLVHAGHKGALAEARADYFHSYSGTAQVVIVGDSIFQNIEWSEFIPGAFNRAIENETTADVLARLPDLAKLHAQTYVIMLGANDVTQGVPPNVSAGNMQRIVDGLPGRKIVMLATPCNPSFYGCDPRAVAALNAKLRTIQRATILPVPADYDAKRDLVDRVHPKGSGQVKLADSVRAVIKS